MEEYRDLVDYHSCRSDSNHYLHEGYFLEYEGEKV